MRGAPTYARALDAEHPSPPPPSPPSPPSPLSPLSPPAASAAPLALYAALAALAASLCLLALGGAVALRRHRRRRGGRAAGSRTSAAAKSARAAKSSRAVGGAADDGLPPVARWMETGATPYAVEYEVEYEAEAEGEETLDVDEVGLHLSADCRCGAPEEARPPSKPPSPLSPSPRSPPRLFPRAPSSADALEPDGSSRASSVSCRSADAPHGAASCARRPLSAPVALATPLPLPLDGRGGCASYSARVAETARGALQYSLLCVRLPAAWEGRELHVSSAAGRFLVPLPSPLPTLPPPRGAEGGETMLYVRVPLLSPREAHESSCALPPRAAEAEAFAVRAAPEAPPLEALCTSAKAELDQIFRAMDTDGDGQIGRYELLSGSQSDGTVRSLLGLGAPPKASEPTRDTLMLLFSWTDTVGLDEFHRAFLPAALQFLEDVSLVAEPIDAEARERFHRLQRLDGRRKQLRAADGDAEVRGGTKTRPEKQRPNSPAPRRVRD